MTRRSERDPVQRHRSRLHRRFALLLAPAMISSNLLGGLFVYVYLVFLSPVGSAPDDPTGTLVNTIVFLGYMALAVVLGIVGSVVVLGRARRWLSRSRDPSAKDRLAALRTPVRLVWVYGTLWATGAVVFFFLNLNDSFGQAARIGLIIAVGGMTTCALSYLLSERLARPVVAEAMRGAPGPPAIVLGVRRRVLLAWSLGSAVPVGGIFVGVLDLAGQGSLDRGGLLFLSGVALVVGFLAMRATARSISDPLESVTRALREVAAGRLDTEVPVYDASEVGQLQAGFNLMAAGLRERARLQDLFGRQVGTDVARLALERGVRLGGERRHVAVLFVDVIGSTSLAVRHEPEEVVRQLNAFFGAVVDAVAGHGGWVNKFEGDAALCIFGAPVELPDAVACALAAARALAEGLEPLELEAAVGVGAGPVVAGNVGTESRFEYTVIGDAVNTAARLAELARTAPGHVLADGAMIAGAGDEAEQWEHAGQVVLRGRTSQTRLARPTG